MKYRLVRSYEYLREFLREMAPFLVAVTCTAVLLTLVYVLYSLGQLHEEEDREDARRMSEAAMTVETAKQLLADAIEGHNGVSRQEHEELLADIAELLARPADQVVVTVPAPRPQTQAPRPAPAPRPTTTTTTTPTTPPSLDTLPLPAPTTDCDRGKSCDKGKKR